MVAIIYSEECLPSFEKKDKWVFNFNQRKTTREHRDADDVVSEEVYEVFHAEVSGIYPTVSTRLDIIKEGIDLWESKRVQRFSLPDGNTAWLDKETRLGLQNSLSVEKKVGKEQYTLWLNGKPYVVSITVLEAFLEDLERFAIEVFNVTQQHKSAVSRLMPDEFFEYDFTTGYPSSLNLSLE